MELKQVNGLRAQVAVVSKILAIADQLESSATPYKADAVFPLRMTARAVNGCLEEARRLLEGAKSTLDAELAFYLDAGERMAALNEGEASQNAKLESIKSEVANREADTAGKAVFAMQSLPASLAFLAKAMENDRSYRGATVQGQVHKQIPGLTAQLNVIYVLLGWLDELETSATAADESAIFPVRMTAEAVGLCLSEARRLLEKARQVLRDELTFFEEADRKVRLVEQGSAGEEEKLAAKTEISRAISNREPLTAGRAVFAMQTLPSVLIFLAKAMENDRGYRS
jgi:hypothetical protein